MIVAGRADLPVQNIHFSDVVIINHGSNVNNEPFEVRYTENYDIYAPNDISDMQKTHLFVM